ncbi:MAG: hypothetical protein GQ581_10775 [Methyloprofundus sp.]|nr:hypothetical protein [Methyloprofundus sp.]
MMQYVSTALNSCLISGIIALLSVANVSAIESINLSIQKISADDWVLHNTQLTLKHIDQANPQISLVAASLALPPPFDKIKLINIHCQQFYWQENYLNCAQGIGDIVGETLPKITFNFALKVQGGQGSLLIKQLSLFGGQLEIDANEIQGKWRLKLKASHIDVSKLSTLLTVPALTMQQGSMSMEIELDGKEENIQELLLIATLNKLSVQDQQGSIATEDLVVKSELKALQQEGAWQWQLNSKILAGSLYVDPIYLAITDAETISLTAHGFWNPVHKKININTVKLEHSNALQLRLDAGILNYQDVVELQAAQLAIKIPELQAVSATYLTPFLAASNFAGISLMGELTADLVLQDSGLTSMAINFEHLVLNDTQQQLQINNAEGQFNWTADVEQQQASYITWQQLQVKAIPFAKGRLDFSSYARQLKLLQPANLQVLDGLLSIKEFSFAAVQDDDVEVHLEALLHELSLTRLTDALGWPPVTGKISGYIPSVRYQNNTVQLDGQLKMQVFGGEVIIKKLASAGLFSALPQLYTDIEFDNLDLLAITKRFELGSIEGRLSGFALNVYLENWQPITFYTWLGTPESDSGMHKISQKAVKNIASIGGASAADAISRSFLGLFDSFYYQKLGFGCYLYQGVCQMMGVAAAEQGFYIIKGSAWIPRIDVVGYNPRMDWDILVQRLARVVNTDEVVIE